MHNTATYDRKNLHSRIELVDFLRALALLAIVLVHAHDHFNFYLYPSAESQPPILNTLNAVADFIHHTFLNNKAFMLFSLLFGLSFFIQMDRAEARGVDFRWRFARRLLLLLLIGVCHSFFFDGDILSIFAIQGLVLIPFYKAKPCILLCVAVGFVLLVPLLTLFIKDWLQIDYFFSYQWEDLGRDRDEIYMNGSFTEVAEWNILFGQTGKWKYIVETGRLGQSFGLFMLGLWAGRKRIFENVDANRKFFKNLFLFSLSAWLISQYLNAAFTHGVLSSSGSLFFVLLVVASAVLVSRTRFIIALSRLIAPVGRTTLTCYITQSIFFTCLFYGWGLQMAPEMGTFLSCLAGAIFFCLQAVWAKWWLTGYKYGPIEWLWRSGTQGKWQQLRKNKPMTDRP